HIPAGKYGELDFYYFPDSLLWGLLLFLAGIFAMSVHFIIDRKRRASI
ncbi:MAG: hypothetical protein JWQ35_1023, partial [Bacteriovoracaceae bacterium]|nr:hypothetical protein [Bacteriovoracaceae bacterium]